MWSARRERKNFDLGGIRTRDPQTGLQTLYRVRLSYEAKREHAVCNYKDVIRSNEDMKGV